MADAAFLALAMHNYKSQPGIADPMLASKIDAVENSFNFAAFARVNDAFNESYTPGSGFVPYTYSGYTNENKVISLAAAISTAHNVPLASTWNADTGRLLVSVTTPSQNYLEYSYGHGLPATVQSGADQFVCRYVGARRR